MEKTALKSATRSQLAIRYGVCADTFKKWITMIPTLDIRPNQRVLTPKQVTIIYQHLGEPPE